MKKSSGTIFYNSEVGMYKTKIDGNEILDCNDKYLEIFGYSRDEMRGKPSITFWADPLEREEMVKRLNKEGHLVNFECRMVNKNGEELNCLTSVRFYKEQGILIGSIIDISDRKQMEARLIKSEEKYQELI